MCNPSCMCHDAILITDTYRAVYWCWQCGELRVEDEEGVAFYPVGQAPEDL